MFNVIRLLNQSVPVIALQVDLLKFGETIFLQFTKVLDVYESVEEVEDSGGEQADRHYWEKRAHAASLEAGNGIISMLPSRKGSPRVTAFYCSSCLSQLLAIPNQTQLNQITRPLRNVKPYRAGKVSCSHCGHDRECISFN